MPPEIRSMTLDDYDEVLALWRRTEGLCVSHLDERDRLAEYFVRNPGLSQVAELEGRIVGAVLCGHDGRAGLLHRLAVDSACRRQGIARAMVDTCLDHLRRQGLLAAFLFVYTCNAQGLAFWESSGWRAMSDCVGMWKDLRPDR